MRCMGVGLFLYGDMMWGFGANRIGGVWIASERHGLAATSAKINFLAIAGFARVRHPMIAAIGVEGAAIVPDVRQGSVAHIVERQMRNGLRGVTGQNLTVRCDVEPGRPPPAHAALGQLIVIVGRNKVDHQPTLELFAGAVDDLDSVLRLFSGRHQRIAVRQGPAVKLHRGNLNAPRADLLGDLQCSRDLMQVTPVQHHVQRDRKADISDPFGHLHLALEPAFVAANFIGQLRRGALQGELHMIEPCFVQLGQAFLGQSDAGCDQIGVKLGVPCRADQINKIPPRCRFAARQVQLQNAQIRSLLECARPCRRVQFLVHPRKLQRVGTIRT